MNRKTKRIAIPRRNRLLLFIKKRILICFAILILTFLLSLLTIFYFYEKAPSTDITENSKSKEKKFEWKNMSSDYQRKCEHYHQGSQYLSVDDFGYICEIKHVGQNGCCKLESDKNRFVCNLCNSEGCCTTYEQCISCCLHPRNEENIKTILKSPLKYMQLIVKKLRNQFELCLAKCRTSSDSVVNQKEYKNPRNKYCFKQIVKEVSLDLDQIS